MTLENLAAGRWVYVYLNDTGLGWHLASDAGEVTVRTPENTRLGNNKMVVLADDGALLGWEGAVGHRPLTAGVPRGSGALPLLCHREARAP